MGTEKYKASVYLTKDEQDLLDKVAKDNRVTKSQALIMGIQALAGLIPNSTINAVSTTINGIDEDRVNKLIDNSKVELLKKIQSLEEMIERSSSELRLELNNSTIELEMRISEMAEKIAGLSGLDTDKPDKKGIAENEIISLPEKEIAERSALEPVENEERVGTGINKEAVRADDGLSIRQLVEKLKMTRQSIEHRRDNQTLSQYGYRGVKTGARWRYYKIQ